MKIRPQRIIIFKARNTFASTGDVHVWTHMQPNTFAVLSLTKAITATGVSVRHHDRQDQGPGAGIEVVWDWAHAMTRLPQQMHLCICILVSYCTVYNNCPLPHEDRARLEFPR